MAPQVKTAPIKRKYTKRGKGNGTTTTALSGVEELMQMPPPAPTSPWAVVPDSISKNSEEVSYTEKSTETPHNPISEYTTLDALEKFHWDNIRSRWNQVTHFSDVKKMASVIVQKDRLVKSMARLDAYLKVKKGAEDMDTQPPPLTSPPATEVANNNLTSLPCVVL